MSMSTVVKAGKTVKADIIVKNTGQMPGTFELSGHIKLEPTGEIYGNFFSQPGYSSANPPPPDARYVRKSIDPGRESTFTMYSGVWSDGDATRIAPGSIFSVNWEVKCIDSGKQTSITHYRALQHEFWWIPPLPGHPYYIGKGVQDPCVPFTFYMFGRAPSPGTVFWELKCGLQIMDPTTIFDLSSISINHEVAIVLYKIKGPVYGGRTITCDWYKGKYPNWTRRIFHIPYSIPDPQNYGYSFSYWSWFDFVSWIGWFYGEIDENGYYWAEIQDSAGPRKIIEFLVVGVH